MSTSVEGLYRNGRVELLEPVSEADGTGDQAARRHACGEAWMRPKRRAGGRGRPPWKYGPCLQDIATITLGILP